MRAMTSQRPASPHSFPAPISRKTSTYSRTDSQVRSLCWDRGWTDRQTDSRREKFRKSYILICLMVRKWGKLCRKMNYSRAHRGEGASQAFTQDAVVEQDQQVGGRVDWKYDRKQRLLRINCPDQSGADSWTPTHRMKDFYRLIEIWVWCKQGLWLAQN